MIRFMPISAATRRMQGIRLNPVFFVLCLVLGWPAAGFAAQHERADGFRNTIEKLASLGDRSTGTRGNRAAADYLRDRLAGIGFDDLKSHRFSLPVRVHENSTLHLPEKNLAVPIHPIAGNAISPGTVTPEGLSGPLYYVGAGRLQDFNDKPIDGSVVVMDMDSGKNWQQAASLGARALIYLDRGPTAKTVFQEKIELTPIQFPRFWMPYETAVRLWGEFYGTPREAPLAASVRLTSDVRWKPVAAENLYWLIPGTDAKLSEELIMVEAFYDSTALVFGRAPGADEACGIASLLDLARFFKTHPPARSVLMVASGAHAQTLTGVREAVWAFKARSRYMRTQKKELKKIVKENRRILKALKAVDFSGQPDLGLDAADEIERVREALTDRVKTESDLISRRLMQLRLQSVQGGGGGAAIEDLAGERLLLRRLSWRSDYRDLTAEERENLKRLLPATIRHHETVLADASAQEKNLRSAGQFRSTVRAKELVAAVSLHFSSHGDGFGAFNQGWLFPLKPQINRVSAYSTLDDVLRNGAAAMEKESGTAPGFMDTLRPSRRQSWESYFADRPPMGGEVTALAGVHGITFATTHDARPFWGTPYDLPETVEMEKALRQSETAAQLIAHLARAPKLHEGIFPRDGFGAVEGSAKFLRHGELFADQPAPGCMILGYQGPGRYHVMVDTLGRFHIRGVADKKHVLHKVILEGYKFDPETGSVQWAIDKKQTGKSAYRVKMQRRFMETALVMFACRETTLFNLLEPRTFRYMTRINVLDGRREAPPLRYWWSRIDTRASTLASIYLEPGSWLKMTLSDTILRNKLVLTRATDGDPMGTGYRVDDWPQISRTEYRVAHDLWRLLAPRISNLERHGIYNERIRQMQQTGTTALHRAETALADRKYDRFSEAASASWALASRVYDQVEEIQKDVLFGVLFYIALFVPFAFCLERLLFSYADIYKRIISFLVILLLVIAVVYHVHPAFQLAYSPLVVVLAFFIMGLSLVVTLIIFFRFEDEMVLLQSRAKQMHTGDISPWKAFTASFFLGVSNLRRRRLRTALTCTTLVILTFTIMSFTSVKSTRQHTRLMLADRTPYSGFLLKNVNWDSLPPEASGVIANAFSETGVVAPRVWLEAEDRTRTTVVPVRRGDRHFDAQAMVGLSAQESRVTGLDRLLTGGRWFTAGDREAVLLPERLAVSIGVDPENPDGETVQLWGVPHRVVGVFSGRRFMDFTDLDGEPLTPVTFPSESSAAMTDVEMEAMESGEDVRSFQSRYQHVAGDLTVIVPYRTLLAAGGQLKSVAIRPLSGTVGPASAERMVDRFGLTLFSGERQGIFFNDAGETMQYSGVPNIIIPLAISVFIVLNTMIGSVYERKREIGIYTSVGLAPSHVSFLFITEALAFAVLSVVFGYLLAQTSAFLFSGSSLWAGITVNYSSLSGVAAMALVILVVLVSVLYPSRVAAQIAIPDVNRSWTLPDAKQNAIAITLPFLVKGSEQRGCGGYLLSHFKGHQDISHGLFSTGVIQVKHEPAVPGDAPAVDPAGLQLHAQVWLAPFDFGIMQDVTLSFRPEAEQPGFLAIHVRLTRRSGEANAWGRVNKAFVNELRKQLLVWRSLDEALRGDFEKLLDGENAPDAETDDR